MRPRLLDLFCGAGGAAMGYHRAGFDVVGVDINPQPRYPFEFWQADALVALAKWESVGTFDAIHASPPCQTYSVTRSLHSAAYPDLVGVTRQLLNFTGLPFVIENVQGAPLENTVKLCGSSFGLGVRRHRLFESNVMLWNPPPCRHELQPEPIDVTGGGPSKGPRLDGKGGRSRKPRTVKEAGDAMGIDWMTRAELNEAIPPAYTAWIGGQLIAQLEAVV